MEAVKTLQCVCLARERFVELLGPLEAIMQREKSEQALPLVPTTSSTTPCLARCNQWFDEYHNWDAVLLHNVG